MHLSNEYVQSGQRQASFGSYTVDEATHTVTHSRRGGIGNAGSCWSARTCRGCTSSAVGMGSSSSGRLGPRNTGRSTWKHY